MLGADWFYVWFCTPAICKDAIVCSYFLRMVAFNKQFTPFCEFVFAEKHKDLGKDGNEGVTDAQNIQ